RCACRSRELWHVSVICAASIVRITMIRALRRFRETNPGGKAMSEKISFLSDGLKIAGLIDLPADYKPGERRPTFIVLHGFGGNKDGHGQAVVAKQFTQWGYVTLRVDFRGCGDSGGERGRIMCVDRVPDTRNAISYMAARPEVDPQRIALVGSSFGAAVAVFTGGADQRVAGVVSCGGWGGGGGKSS